MLRLQVEQNVNLESLIKLKNNSTRYVQMFTEVDVEVHTCSAQVFKCSLNIQCKTSVLGRQ